MKMTWTEPRIEVQEFIPNEYVAVCWSVGCLNNTTFRNHESNAPFGNLWNYREGDYDQAFSHDGDCRDAGNNYFRGEADGTGLAFVLETSHDQGNLTGGLDRWIDVNENGKVDGNGQPGSDVIYWNTYNGTRRWNHWGYVQTAASDHPNRS